PLSRCATASRRTSACAANPNFRASRFSIPPYTISPPKSHPFSWNVNILQGIGDVRIRFINQNNLCQKLFLDVG
ncbi:MAG: hypothetical protein ACK5WY_08750, partial [Holosporaceae bacterium]